MRSNQTKISYVDLMIAANAFFDKGNNPSRLRKNVYARTAFSNAFYSLSKLADIGRVLNRHHATIIYYLKSHNSLIAYQDYKSVYEEALKIREEIAGNLEGNNVDPVNMLKTINKLRVMIESMRREISDSKNKIEQLLKYKEKYEALKKVVQEG